MNTIRNCNFFNFQSDQFNIEIMRSISANKCFLPFFSLPDIFVPNISKTNEVRNLKQTQKVAHISDV